MSKVIQLAPKPEPKPDADVVGLLKDLLAQAEKGDLRGVALVGQLGDGSVEHTIVGEIEPYRIIGALEIVKTDLLLDTAT